MILFPPTLFEQQANTGFGHARRVGPQEPPQANGPYRQDPPPSGQPLNRSVKLFNQEGGSDDWQGMPSAGATGPLQPSGDPGRVQPTPANPQSTNGPDPRCMHLGAHHVASYAAHVLLELSFPHPPGGSDVLHQKPWLFFHNHQEGKLSMQFQKRSVTGLVSLGF